MAFTLPTCLLFLVYGWIVYQLTRDELERELGTRLEAVAASSATQLKAKYLVDLAPGDEEELFYKNARRKLDAILAATGVARLYVLDREYRLRVGTDGDSIGTTLFRAGLDDYEIAGVLESGTPASSVLFEGRDGRLYKTGYAALGSLIVAADAPATFFVRLDELRDSLLVAGALLLCLVAAGALLLASFLTRPLRDLARAATTIASGDMSQPIEYRSADEIGALAEAMEHMRTEVRTRDERLQMMLAGIAHEVRNPLGGMELYVGILREELSGDEERRAHVDKIGRELAYLSRVVEGFLTYARRDVIETAPLELGGLCRDVLDLLDTSRVSLETAIEETHVVGDAGQLRQVVINLVKNAVQAAGGEPATVFVGVHCRQGRARVTVGNTGDPVPAEVMEKMFDPFFTTKEKGTGLGLALARDIIRDHKGDLTVRAVDTGTEFCIDLPLTTAKES